MAGLSVVGLDPLTPTFFEMVLCDSLTRTARPAFLHLLSTIARRTTNVGSLGMYMLSFREEVYACTHAFKIYIFLIKDNYLITSQS